MSEIYDVIEAFIDDEVVDPTELDQALAQPSGRAHLIDAIALRGLVRRSSAMPAVVAKPVPRSSPPLLWLCAAAGISIAASIGGYLAGTRAVTTRPPETAASVAAPAPTQVIRFTPGLDWTERAGGN